MEIYQNSVTLTPILYFYDSLHNIFYITNKQYNQTLLQNIY